MSQIIADRIILGVAESDCHAVANQLIQLSLEQAGYVVTNLGVCTPVSDFANAVERFPDTLAVAIGSMNGHAVEDLTPIRDIRASGGLLCPIIVGGNLSVGPSGAGKAVDALHEIGVEYVLPDAPALLECVGLLSRARRPVLDRTG